MEREDNQIMGKVSGGEGEERDASVSGAWQTWVKPSFCPASSVFLFFRFIDFNILLLLLVFFFHCLDSIFTHCLDVPFCRL